MCRRPPFEKLGRDPHFCRFFDFDFPLSRVCFAPLEKKSPKPAQKNFWKNHRRKNALKKFLLNIQKTSRACARKREIPKFLKN
jgi:hypothetical protein